MMHYFLKIQTTLVVLLILIIAVSCNSDIPAVSDQIESKDSLLGKDSIIMMPVDTMSSEDTSSLVPKKVERYRDEKKLSLPTFLRTQEIGNTNEKFNGEAVLIQLDLPQKSYEANPEIINDHVKGNYAHSKNYFPQDSRNKVASIKLNYRIELFEDGYAVSPYKVIELSYSGE